jgi:two-component sensor histidine kinase/CheY-like chemotaxis protein
MSARVLLVDDEALTAEYVCLNLSGEGYAADYVVSGEECIAHLETDSAYDVILMDIELGPGHMTGTEATREVRSRYDLPVVFYTGHADAETVAPTRSSDAYGCVFKADGDLQVLVSSIEHARHRWRTERSILRQHDALLSLVRGLDLFVFVFDRADQRVLFVNDAARKRFEDTNSISGTEIFGVAQSTSFEDYLAPGDAPARRLSEAITDDEKILYHESTGRWYAVTVSPIVWGERGDAYLVVSLDVTEVVEDRRRLANDLERTQLRLEEVNHRIKNNLALVQSLVHFSESELPDGYDLADLYHQIRALRVLYHRLAVREDTGTVDLSSYVTDILGGVFHPGERAGVTVEIDVPARPMQAGSATPLGLILSELALNAVKHAFSPARENRFRVAAREEDDGRCLVLEVADNAAALPEDVELHDSGTTGLRLVVSLVRQLEGSIEVERGDETKFEIRLPLLHFAD